MSVNLAEHIEVAELYQFYKPLLTEKQQLMIQYYYLDNYTLSEIAEIENISRNAVHDQLKRTVVKLHDFEMKLQLKEKSLKRESILNDFKDQMDEDTFKALIDTLMKVE
ncbi:MAG: YlxM family DNA-binding protein [Candidatus Izemoplasmataceae bacterium]